MNSRIKDIAGKRFGKLTAIAIAGTYRPIRWACKCDCGKELVVRLSGLTHGNTVSCGCIRSEACKERERLKGYPDWLAIQRYYKQNARVGGFSWNLTPDQFISIIAKRCSYCESRPTQRIVNGKLVSYNGIDRIDSNKGYIIDNCLPCCEICNKAKLDADMLDFLNWQSRLANHNK